MTHYLGPLLRGIFKPKPIGMPQDQTDPVGDAVRAAIDDHERAAAAAQSGRHDITSAIEDLLGKMDRHG